MYFVVWGGAFYTNPNYPDIQYKSQDRPCDSFDSSSCLFCLNTSSLLSQEQSFSTETECFCQNGLEATIPYSPLSISLRLL